MQKGREKKSYVRVFHFCVPWFKYYFNLFQLLIQIVEETAVTLSSEVTSPPVKWIYLQLFVRLDWFVVSHLRTGNFTTSSRRLGPSNCRVFLQNSETRCVSEALRDRLRSPAWNWSFTLRAQPVRVKVSVSGVHYSSLG